MLRNCRQTTGNPESKYKTLAIVFYSSKKDSKLSDLGSIVSDHQENMRFSCIYKGIPFINEPNTHFLVRPQFLYRDIYEKSTFSLDTIAPSSLQNQKKQICKNKMTADVFTFKIFSRLATVTQHRGYGQISVKFD